MAGQNDVPRRTVLAAAALVPAAMAVGAARAQTAEAVQASNSKVALVTGSSRGIGAATAKRLARDGYAVTVNCVINRKRCPAATFRACSGCGLMPGHERSI